MGNFMELARQEFAAFHRDEEGLTTVEGLLLLGAGVLIMIGLLKWLPSNVTQKVTQQVNTLFGSFRNF